jgi:hypothetical protein
VAVALEHLALDLARDHELERRQLPPEPLEIHHAVVLGRPAGAAADLLRAVGLEQEHAPRREALLHAGVHAAPHVAGDVRVDAHDAVPRAGLDLELVEVGAQRGERDAALGREPPRALEPDG